MRSRNGILGIWTERERYYKHVCMCVCVCVCMRERQKRGTVIYSPQQEHPVTDTKPEDLLSVPESPQLKKDYEAIPATLQKERKVPHTIGFDDGFSKHMHTCTH